MNYILTCPHCKVEDTYSTKDASDIQDTDGTLSREWECKKCGQSIVTTPFLAFEEAERAKEMEKLKNRKTYA